MARYGRKVAAGETTIGEELQPIPGQRWFAEGPASQARGGGAARSRRLFLVLIAIACFGFALRLGVAAKFQGLSAPPDAESNPDQLDYEEFGWQLAHGGGYTLKDGTPTARRPPGTSLALYPVYLLFGRDWAAARVWFCAISAATCLFTGLLAAELFGALAAIIAAALLALLPGHFYYAMHFLSEVPYGLAITAACWLVVRGLKRGDGIPPLRSVIGTGLLFGFALLTRPQVAFAGLFAPLAALASSPANRGARLRQVLLVGVTTLALVVPWIVRNEVVLGKATLSTIGGFTFWGANNAVIAADPATAGSWMPVEPLIDASHPLDGTELENDAACWRYGLEFLRSNPGAIPRLLVMKLVRHLSPFRITSNRAVYWSFALAWLVVGPLAVIGAWLGLRRLRAATFVVLAPALSTLTTALIFYGSIRFRDADAPLYVVPAAAVIAIAIRKVWPRIARR